jgi:hypothetical protein
MKTFLYDYTNFGIVYVNEDERNSRRPMLSILRSCILDTNIGNTFPKNPIYAELTNSSIREKFYHIDKLNGVAIGQSHEVNEYFIEKQRRAQLMVPLINMLLEGLSRRSLGTLNDYIIPMDDTISIEILKSDPVAQVYSSGIVEYARTLGIEPAQAYIELELDYKTHHAVKMRTYAMTKRYMNLIREVKTTDDANSLLADMKQRLITDSFI